MSEYSCHFDNLVSFTSSSQLEIDHVIQQPKETCQTTCRGTQSIRDGGTSDNLGGEEAVIEGLLMKQGLHLILANSGINVFLNELGIGKNVLV